MSLEHAILERLRALPPEKQQEVLDFADFLHARITPKGARRDVEGMCADLEVSISGEEIAEARREMWGGFPREFPVVER
ncbi:MAG: DUF2281 domain-containing protein [Bryobacteraceae bacterium]